MEPTRASTRRIDLIVIHCAASPNGRWHAVADIDSWHRQRGFKRDAAACRAFNPALPAIGYHWVIYTNGGRASGRHLNEVGAHAANWNAHSIGVCLVGTDAFSREQWKEAADQVRYLAGQLRIPLSLPNFKAPAGQVRGVCGHRDLPGVAKACPGFSVADWLAADLAPLPGHLLTVSD